MPYSIIQWDGPMVEMMRYIISDYDPTNQTYSDDTLKSLILYGSVLIFKDILFALPYVIDMSQLTITPDPVVNKDFAFINLSILKAACLLSRNELKASANDALKWKDGQSSFDGSDRGKIQKAVTDSICKEFWDAKMQYEFGDVCPGKVMLGPFSSDRISYGTDAGFLGTNGSNYFGRNSANYASQGFGTP